MTNDTIWRWFCSLSSAELADHGEPILEMRCHADARRSDEPILLEEGGDSGLPELNLP